MKYTYKIIAVCFLVAAMLCITAFARTISTVYTDEYRTITVRMDAEKPTAVYYSAQVSMSLASREVYYPEGEVFAGWIYLFGTDAGENVTLSYVADSQYDYGKTLATPNLILTGREVTALRSESYVMGYASNIYRPDDLIMN